MVINDSEMDLSFKDAKLRVKDYLFNAFSLWHFKDLLSDFIMLQVRIMTHAFTDYVV